MNATEAQAQIAKMTPYRPPTKADLKKVAHLKVDHRKLSDFPKRKRGRLQEAIDFIVDEYAPPSIDLVMSQLDGYPVDEKTSTEDFGLLRQVFGSAKLSDWDFVVPNAFGQHILHHLLKVDIFALHHNDVAKLRVYTA